MSHDDGIQVWRDVGQHGTKIYIDDTVFHRAGEMPPVGPLFAMSSAIAKSAMLDALDLARDAACPPMMREAREQRRRNYLRRFPYLRAFIQ